MNRCKTCRWWDSTASEIEWIPARNILQPHDPIEYTEADTPEKVKALFGYNVGLCKSPKVLFYEFPSRDGACVVDGSQYAASLVTAEEFGCVLHEEKLQ